MYNITWYQENLYQGNKKVANIRYNLELFYRKSYDKFKGFTDDRRLFCNIFEKIVETLNELMLIQSPMIWSAFYKAYHADREIMDRIQKRFEGRNG